MKKILFCLLSLFSMQLGFSQDKELPKNWFNLDQATDNYPGMSTEKLYKTLLQDKKGVPVIVAVIDCGVDYMHEDLKDVMWKNPKEIPGNNIDDDRNGYIDDVYGWNFLGGRDGKNVNEDNLEITRIVRAKKNKFSNTDVSKLKGKDKEEYEEYLKMKKDVETQKQNADNSLKLYSEMQNKLINAEKKLKAYFGKEEITLEQLELIKNTDSPELKEAVGLMTNALKNGFSSQDLQGAVDHFKGQAEYQYNLDFNPRSIVGDKYANSNERYYGNPDIKGPNSFHGTHVAGIIAGDRSNNKGIEGVANNVKIMGVRCVPDGDEHDKDVANSIRYAVDNGAQVINMSFGKAYKWDKKAVDEAVKYAMSKDVLLVHAAGNDGKNNDNTNNFPNDKFEHAGLFSKKYAPNWLEVGAASFKTGENAVAGFSNYGKKNVDVFAPGVQIYSTTPENTYGNAQGTSMASPMVAGVAAVIRSYYPQLTAEQVKKVIMDSCTKNNGKVKKPGTKGELVPFSDLSVTGGNVNVYEAIKLASKTKGKKKIKSMDNNGGMENSEKNRS